MEVFGLIQSYVNLIDWLSLAQTSSLFNKFCHQEKFWQNFYHQKFGCLFQPVISWKQEYQTAYLTLAFVYEGQRFLPILNDNRLFRGISAVSIGSMNIILERNGQVWLPTTFPKKSSMDDYLDKQICILNGTKWKVQEKTCSQILIGSHQPISDCELSSQALFGLDLQLKEQKYKLCQLPPIIAIDQGKNPLASFNHYLLLDQQGKVWSFGYNFQGQCGFQSIKNIVLPTLIPNLPRIYAISAGRQTSLFLDDQNKVWVCGNNSIGQLGLPINNKVLPTKLDYLPPISKIFAGYFSTFLINTNGYLWGNAWDKSMDKSMNKSMNKSVNKSGVKSSDESVNKSVDKLVDNSADESSENASDGSLEDASDESGDDFQKNSESKSQWENFWINPIDQIINQLIDRSDAKNAQFIQIDGLPPILEVVPLQTLTFVLTSTKEIWVVGYPGFLPGTGDPFDNLLLTFDPKFSPRKLKCSFPIQKIIADTDYCFVVGEHGELAQLKEDFTFSIIPKTPRIIAGSVSNFANLFIGKIL